MALEDKDTIQDWNTAYTQAIQVWGPWLEESNKDLKASLGDQWDSQDKEYLVKERRNVLAFNRIRRVIKLITGFQRKNRLALKISPVEGSDEMTADQFSMLVQHIMEQGVYHTMSEAFEGSLKTAINLVSIYTDFSRDMVNGDFGFKRVPFNRFLLDPNFADRLLKDCQYLLRREWLARDAIKPLLPMVDPKEIDGLRIKGRDEKFIVGTAQPKDLFGKDLLRYDEFFVRETRPVQVLLDPMTGTQKVWRGDKDRLKLFLTHFPSIKVLDRHEPYIKQSIIIEDNHMWSGPDPSGLGNDFSFVPVICFYDPEYETMKWKLQGVVRCMRDPQTEANKRRSKILDMMDSQLSPYRIFEEDALVEDSQAYQTGQGKVIWAKSGAIGKGKIQIHPAPDIPAGLFRICEIMDRDIDEIPGGSADLLGTPENPDIQVAGILAKMRQSSGLTILQDIFDNYRLAKKDLGRKLVTMIQNNWTPAKVKRICGQEPSPEFYGQNFGTYDAIPQEGILTESQRHMYFAQLVAMKNMGAPIPWAAIVDAAPIEQKSRLKEVIQQQEKAQAAQAQTDIMDKKLTQGLQQAKIAADLGRGEERKTQAIENMANATLDRIKTIREIGRLDDQHLLQLIDWIRGMETGEKVVPAAKGGGQKLLTKR